MRDLLDRLVDEGLDQQRLGFLSGMPRDIR